jgi:hypothetical protein
MSPEFAWQITGALVVLLAILVGFFWFRTPVIFLDARKTFRIKNFSVGGIFRLKSSRDFFKGS